MERIYRVWEIELQAVLEINKLGHRKRILYSVAGQQQSKNQPKNNIKDISNDISSLVSTISDTEKRKNNKCCLNVRI